ncbi:stereocilin isoform X3 [Sceloporus undulatus]|uniref:stereocilin isoform X3 n=1 Tax=Sceloporus undulatus TaxID=8520 RepID=UPI001C4D1858|nr:stereocilin isoform X3 [Sceloporus undulatus]
MAEQGTPEPSPAVALPPSSSSPAAPAPLPALAARPCQETPCPWWQKGPPPSWGGSLGLELRRRRRRRGLCRGPGPWLTGGSGGCSIGHLPHKAWPLVLLKAGSARLDGPRGSSDSVAAELLRLMGRNSQGAHESKQRRRPRPATDRAQTQLQHLAPQQQAPGSLQQLILWGIKHNISWSIGMLGIASTRAFPQWLFPVPDCPSPDGGPAPRRHERSSGATQGPSLDQRSPAEVLLEAACNGSAPPLPGVSNFTLYLYCHLFNSSKEPGQSPLDLEAMCSDAAWYLSSMEGDSVWAQACKETFPLHFNKTASGHAPLLWYCFLEKGEGEEEWWTFWTQNLLSRPGQGEFLKDLRQQLSVLCRHPGPNATAHQSSHWCDPSMGIPQAPCHASFLGKRRGGHRCRFWALVCICGSLMEGLQGIHPWVKLHCLAKEEEGRACWCCFWWMPGMPPVPTWLCQHASSFLVRQLSQLVWCPDLPPSSSSSSCPQWVPSAAGFLLWLLDFLLALPALEEVGQGVRQPLGQDLLLAGLLGNYSSWASFQAHVALQDVSWFLREGQDAAAKDELLQCFSPLIWDLLQSGEKATALGFFMQVPPRVVQTLLQSAESEAAQWFLALLHHSWPQLQVSPWEDPVLRLLIVQLLSTLPRLSPQLALQLSHFVPAMTVPDILHLPPALLANNSVLAIISSQSARMTPAQKRALVRRLLQTRQLGDIPSWPSEFLHTVGPLLPHLPLHHFLQLTPQQIQALADSWQEVDLGVVQGRHVARGVAIGSHRSTEELVHRLGSLICFLSLEELHKISALHDLRGPVEKRLLECVASGLLDPQGQLAHILVGLLHPVAPGSQELHAWQSLMPAVRVDLLQNLSDAQVVAILPDLQMAQLSHAQAVQLENVSARRGVWVESSLCLRGSGEAPQLHLPSPLFCCPPAPFWVTWGGAGPLCSLLPGLGPQSLAVAVLALLAEGCACVGSTVPQLSGPQKAALLQASLQRHSPQLSVLSTHLDCLLPILPLQLLQVDTQALLGRGGWHPEAPWAPQQAQFLWQKMEARINVTQDVIRAMGCLAVGMSCTSLQALRERANFPAVLEALYSQGCCLPWTLRGCIWEEIQREPGLTGREMTQLGPQFLLDLPAPLLDKLPAAPILLILDYVRRNPRSLLAVPPTRRATLAQRSLQALMPQPEEGISATVLHLLGPLVGFLDPQTVAHIDPAMLLYHLDELREACLEEEMTKALGQRLVDALGDPAHWSWVELEQLGHLVFLLPLVSVQQIAQAALHRDVVEQLLQSQRAWEASEGGRLCSSLPGADWRQRQRWQRRVQAQKEALVRRSLEGDPEGSIPTCSDLRATFPSAWSAVQIHTMDQGQFHDCLSVISQDPTLSPDQGQAALHKAKQVLGPVRAMGQLELLELGWLALHLTEEELHGLEIPDWGVLAVLGGLEGWTERQMRAVSSRLLRQRQQSGQSLGMLDLVALGHLLCGLQVGEIQELSGHEFSKAAPFVGSLMLHCSEEKLEALAGQLEGPLAFGPAAFWGPGIFTEIGTLAAGLPDLTLSSLVPEQLRALTPCAVALIPAPKFTAVFSPGQIRSLTSLQASAVTPQQSRLLSPEQREALALARCEGQACQDQRGWNRSERCHPAVSLLLLPCLLLCLWGDWGLQ